MDSLLILDAFMAVGSLVIGIWAFKTGDIKRALGAAAVFGLLAGVMWIRLGANDVLLAEAAIGAALCALLLGAVLVRLSARRKRAVTTKATAQKPGHSRPGPAVADAS